MLVAGTGVLLSGCNLGQRPITYEVPGQPWGRQGVVDVDGDGHGDLLVGTTVLFGDGAGFDTAPLQVPEDLPTERVLFSDLDGDDFVDMVGLGDAGVFSSLGDGSGTFGPARYIAAGEPLLFDMAIGDVDGDTHADLLALHGTNGGEVWLGDGTGGFGNPIPLGVPQFFIAQGAVVDDLDADGDADLAVTAVGPAVGEGALTVFLGDGTGAFAPPALYPTARTSPCGLVLGDVDGDGTLDAVTTSSSSGGAVLLGDGAGGFEPAIPLPSVGSCSAALGDIDGDDRLDLVARPSTRPVSVQFGDGEGGFGDAHELAHGSPVVHDVDDDGKPDVVLPGGDVVRVFMNRLDGRPSH